MPLTPFLKWPGGKRWFVSNYDGIVPRNVERYIEPFLGSGALYFHLMPKAAILGDINEDLVETYSAIRENWQAVSEALTYHQKRHCKEYYYRTRATVPPTPHERAARFIYLNRTCWNGLYRVNRKGEFNVPMGTRMRVTRESDDFEAISRVLSSAELICADFERLVDRAQEGDFVFADPPYTVRHNQNGFIKYNDKLFSWDDQRRLAQSLKAARDRGAIVLATNAYHESICTLYKNSFQTMRVSRYSSISGKSSSRKSCEELLVMSHPPEELSFDLGG